MKLSYERGIQIRSLEPEAAPNTPKSSMFLKLAPQSVSNSSASFSTHERRVNFIQKDRIGVDKKRCLV